MDFTCEKCGRRTAVLAKEGVMICATCDRSSDGDPLLSAAVAAATDSAVLGALVGGSITGAVLGDLLDGDLFD